MRDRHHRVFVPDNELEDVDSDEKEDAEEAGHRDCVIEHIVWDKVGAGCITAVKAAVTLERVWIYEDQY